MGQVIRNGTYDRGYTKISNELINSPDLSGKAKAVLIYILSKPPNWETRTEDIVAHMRDGIDGIKAAIKELTTAGYLIRRKLKNESGRFCGWETIAYEHPLPKVDFPTVGTESGFSDSGKTDSGKTDSGKVRNRKKPESENPPLQRTEFKQTTDLEQKTDLTNSLLSHAKARDVMERGEVSRGETVSVAEDASIPVSADWAGQDKRSSAAPAAAKKAPQSNRKSKSRPERSPEEFDQWWAAYYAFCLDVDQSAGKRTEAAAAWDDLLSDEDCLDRLIEGTAHYISVKTAQFKSRGEAKAVSHGIRYLRDLKWQEALDHKRLKSEPSTPTPYTPPVAPGADIVIDPAAQAAAIARAKAILNNGARVNAI